MLHVLAYPAMLDIRRELIRPYVIRADSRSSPATSSGLGVIVPFAQPAGGRVLAVGNRCHNRLQRFLRGRGERGFALLTERWATLKHTALSPSRIGDLARAAHVLTLFEHHRIH